ncbi:hypothetical protein HRI_001444300 [Hibiscus trionum]|uniref:Uncharacterized protein n=1 Tax=Hibiscus trionum TaxID=183268 RepID=A0A9W7LWM4_HIBTR|nr:hypothetical protein HRI_001444300 [Hibiscus trionum]
MTAVIHVKYHLMPHSAVAHRRWSFNLVFSNHGVVKATVVLDSLTMIVNDKTACTKVCDIVNSTKELKSSRNLWAL